MVEESAEEIPVLVKREDGFLWLDVPVWTSELDELLAAELKSCIRWRGSTAGCVITCRWCMGTATTCSWCCTGRWCWVQGNTLLVEFDIVRRGPVRGDGAQAGRARRSPRMEGMSEIEETLARINGGRIRAAHPDRS